MKDGEVMTTSTGLKVAKTSLKDRKKAQPNALVYFSPVEKQTIIDTVAKSLTEPQRNVFFYTAQALGLNPLLNEIAAISYNVRQKDGTFEKKMSIQVMRDGFLSIAHRSGKFAGIESGVKTDEDNKLIGWAKVYHKDYDQPVYQEADFDEYKTDRNPLWISKPKTMIKKVAESMALRKAFNANGVYSPEEMEKEITVITGESKLIDELDEKSVQKINGAKNLQELNTIAKQIKDEKDPKYHKHLIEVYTKRKEQIEHGQ